MLVFFSDVHLTDGSSGETISAEAFDHFADQVADLAHRREARQVRLVLLGDGLDAIRSTRWLMCPDTCRPWTPPGPDQEAVALDVMQAILGHNREAIEHLRAISARVAGRTRIPAGRVRLDYVLGNHDWLINRYPSLRRLVAERLGLSRLYAEHGFPSRFVSPAAEYDTVARHGHEYDWQVCGHPGGDEASIFGDAVVVELINRLPVAVGEELAGDASRGEVVRRLKEIDNVRPYAHIPAWVNGALSEVGRDSPELRDAARRALRRCVDSFLGNARLKGLLLRHLPWPRRLAFRLLLEQVRRMKVGTLDWGTVLAFRAARAARALVRGERSAYARHAARELGADGIPPRFVVYGHTHEPETVALGPSTRDGADRFYFNTGTWRPVWELAETADGRPHFSSWKEMSYVVIYAAGEGGRRHEFEVRRGSLRDRPLGPAAGSSLALREARLGHETTAPAPRGLRRPGAPPVRTGSRSL